MKNEEIITKLSNLKEGDTVKVLLSRRDLEGLVFEERKFDDPGVIRYLFDNSVNIVTIKVDKTPEVLGEGDPVVEAMGSNFRQSVQKITSS